MLGCGVLGFFMRRFGMSPAALVIALVLGPLAEETLRQTMIISGGSFDIFVDRGLSRVLLVLMALLVLLPLVTRAIGRRRPTETEVAGRFERAEDREDEPVAR